jgi:hypothetical protein
MGNVEDVVLPVGTVADETVDLADRGGRAASWRHAVAGRQAAAAACGRPEAPVISM